MRDRTSSGRTETLRDAPVLLAGDARRLDALGEFESVQRIELSIKTLEYLAAGRAAITTDLPAARCLNTDLVTICANPDDFTKRTLEALDAPDNPSLLARRQAFAETHSWDARGRDFARLLGLLD